MTVLKKILAAASLAAVAALVLSSVQIGAKPGGGCTVRDNGCTASDITFTPDSNPTPPFPPCPQGVTMHKLNATISCGLSVGGGTQVSLYVCPATAQPASKLIDGQWHIFEPASGRTWQDVINDCSYLTYTVN